MSLLDAFARVSKRQPCPVCERGDWCLVSREGGDIPVAAICSRVENSNRWGEAGWFHRLAAQTPARRRSRTRSIPAPGRDFSLLAERFRSNCCDERREALARGLGVTTANLMRLGIGWTGGAFSFPMQDGVGTVRGIRLRFPDGRRCAVTGSREGVFLPTSSDGRTVRTEATRTCSWDVDVSDLLFIAEGPTDTAALLDLGFQAIGRPSCSGGRKQVIRYVRSAGPARTVVVADQDPPGESGARSLAVSLAVHCRDVRVVVPPGGLKDAREWVRAGASREAVMDTIRAAQPVRLQVQRRCGRGAR